MKEMFTEKYMKCDGCQYVGRFLNNVEVNDKSSNVKCHYILHKDNFSCPKCGQITTKDAQADKEEITNMAYNARDKENG